MGIEFRDGLSKRLMGRKQRSWDRNPRSRLDFLCCINWWCLVSYC